MSLKLVADNPGISNNKRVLRLAIDVKILSHLSASEIKPLYGKIEAARDALSRILDRADNKSA